jgi:acyl transferase domain-containing protein
MAAMRCAIIGLACLFPGAPDLEAFWQNIESGVDAISDVPEGRWDKQFYDPASLEVDRFYCRRGGFVDAYAEFDPLRFGVVPKSAASIEPDQLLTLRVGFDALRDAGYAERPFPRDRTGVVLGRGNYIGAGVLNLEQHVRLLPQILQTLTDLFPDLPAQALEAARSRLKEKLAYYGPDAAAGMIPNLLASRLANRLDLHGPAYTLDAACASSLLAVEHACTALASGGMDMMLAGGVHLTHDLTFWATFCQLGALSRAGIARPFARQADGILAGEGIGVAVLKRLDDALEAGDRIYAVIEGCGASSDGRSGSLVSPAVAGQLQALEKAWMQAGLCRDSIGLLEAHGTGTPAGDAVELETLRTFFGQSTGARPVVGSVKSMIGHAMPASGIASLIKASLAIHHGVLPPTLHCEDPNPLLHETRFRVIGQAETWAQPPQERVAAVNAFGFGGINAHVVLRGHAEAPARSRAIIAIRNVMALPEVLLLSGATPAEILAQLDAGPPYPRPGSSPCRLAIVAPDPARIATARRAVATGKPWAGRQNIYFSPLGLLASGGKMAFVFPGVGSTFAPQADGLQAAFGIPLPPHCETLDPAASLTRVVAGLLGFNSYLFGRLSDLGLQADAFAGHSVGEWSAMHAAGMTRQSLATLLSGGLDLDAVEFPDALFLSAACSAAEMHAFLQGLDDAALSHDNCPHQVIACGKRHAIAALAARLRDARVLHQILPIVSGFHSPLFAGHMRRYETFFASDTLAEPRAPVWSATIAAPFPASPEEKRRLALDHLLKPVRFRAMIKALHDAQIRVFVEVGTGALKHFIGDTLAGKPHLAIECNREDRGGLAQLQHLSAALWVEGARFDTRLLKQAQPAAERTPGTMRLALGVPLVRIARPLERSLLPPSLAAGALTLPAANANDPLHSLLRATLEDIDRAGREVLAAWQAHTGAAAAAPRAISIKLQQRLDIGSTIPFVKDHELYPQRPG